MSYFVTPPFKINGGGVVNLKLKPVALSREFSLVIQYSPSDIVNDFSWLENSVDLPKSLEGGMVFFDNPVIFEVFKENLDVNFRTHKSAKWIRCVYEAYQGEEPNFDIQFKEV
jgi:hypothetical protein